MENETETSIHNNQKRNMSVLEKKNYLEYRNMIQSFSKKYKKDI